MLKTYLNAFYRPSGITVILIVFIYFIKSGALISELTAIFYSLISIVSILNSVIGIQVNINNFLPRQARSNVFCVFLKLIRTLLDGLDLNINSMCGSHKKVSKDKIFGLSALFSELECPIFSIL